MNIKHIDLDVEMSSAICYVESRLAKEEAELDMLAAYCTEQPNSYIGIFNTIKVPDDIQ